MARLSDAVVIGSCRTGGTSAVDLNTLRRAAEAIWDTIDGSDSGSDSDSDSGSNNESSDSERTGSQGKDSSGDDSSVIRSNGSKSDSDQDEARNRSSGRMNGDGRGSDFKSNGSGMDSRRRGKDAGDETRPAAGTLKASSGQKGPAYAGVKSRGKLHAKDEKGGNFSKVDRLRGTSVAIKQALRRSNGGGSDSGEGGGAARRHTGVTARRGTTSVQCEKNRASTPVYDRAIYEETSSVFGRVFRDALSGECIQEGHHKRILIADLYGFLRRHFQPFERPRDEVDVAEPPVSKPSGREAARKEKERKAKLRPKALAETVWQLREAAQKQVDEEEDRRRTQVRTQVHKRIVF